MQIAKIKIPESETKKVNLKEINITNKPLGSIVALVGKNGAGKSRILKFVENYIFNIKGIDFIEDHLTNIPSNITREFEPAIKQYKNNLKKHKANHVNSSQNLEFEKNINIYLDNVIQKLKVFGNLYIKKIDNDELQNIKTQIFNGNLSFKELLTNRVQNNYLNGNHGPRQNTESFRESYTNEFNEFNVLNSHQTINYFTELTTEILNKEFEHYIDNRENPNLVQEKIRDEESFKLFSKFQKYIFQFLGKEFSYKNLKNGSIITSLLYFNNEPFDIINLSPGQKTLFAYAVLFFYLDTNTSTNIRECILIIDEPEKHLHPEAQILLVNALRNIIGETGQLWMSTHSIHILSHLNFDEILMVKDDEIILPSRLTPGKSFNDLMGLEEHILELKTFINSISEWAYGNFIIQCFKNPDVIFNTNNDDPQFKLFKQFIKDKTQINLLDFGAGKGRIGYTIKEDESISNKILYNAFEPDKTKHEILSKINEIRILISEPSKLTKETFDIVVLCNVLHEITPKNWLETFALIKSCLTEDGYLIIIEDRFLPKGETAHEFGYLILNTEETNILMQSKNNIELRLKEKEYEERIIFNAFQKSEICPTIESVNEAINKLKINTFNNIKSLKKSPQDLNQGRRLANETQLYINAQLYLESQKK